LGNNVTSLPRGHLLKRINGDSTMSLRHFAVLLPVLLVGATQSFAADALAVDAQAAGREPSKAVRSGRVATLNVKKVLKILCEDDLRKLTAECDTRDLEAKLRLANLMRKANALPFGVEDEELYRDLQSPRVDLAPSVGNDFFRREAAIIAKAYRSLQREVADYCKTEGIDLVLDDDVTTEKVDPSNPDALARDISKRIVVAKLDITSEILKRLAAKGNSADKAK
jgi:hypothetical protein